MTFISSLLLTVTLAAAQDATRPTLPQNVAEKLAQDLAKIAALGEKLRGCQLELANSQTQVRDLQSRSLELSTKETALERQLNDLTGKLRTLRSGTVEYLTAQSDQRMVKQQLDQGKATLATWDQNARQFQTAITGQQKCINDAKAALDAIVARPAPQAPAAPVTATTPQTAAPVPSRGTPPAGGK